MSPGRPVPAIPNLTRPAAARVARRRPQRQPARPPHARRRHRPRRCHRRSHPALELGRRRGARQPDQDAQTANVRPSRIPAPAKAITALQVTDASRRLSRWLVPLIDSARSHAENQVLHGVRHLSEAGNPGLNEIDHAHFINAQEEPAVVQLADRVKMAPDRFAPLRESVILAPGQLGVQLERRACTADSWSADIHSQTAELLQEGFRSVVHGEADSFEHGSPATRVYLPSRRPSRRLQHFIHL
jgi:hypothetical protein